MAIRDKGLQAQKEYEQALRDAEAKKPEGTWYKLSAADGSQCGRIIYSPDTDTLAIETSGAHFQIAGKYLDSIKSALNKLLSETEQ